MAIGCVCAGTLLLVQPAQPAPDVAFSRWLESLWPQAQSNGVSRKTFSAAIHGLEPDLTLPDLELPSRKGRPQPQQAEFVQTPSDYIRELSISRLAERGKKLAAEHRATLAKIEQRFGVPPSMILAIWGRETAYGGHKLPHNAIRVLATQGFYGRRKDMFREELLFAFKILEEGHVTLDKMRSSWGGAMGLTQFLPSEFYKHAVDFDGDGHRDIWGSIPDALASAAQQLVNKGWKPGQRWAYEVRVPANVDCTTGTPEFKQTVAEWVQKGYTPTLGRRPSQTEMGEPASLLAAGRDLRAGVPHAQQLLRDQGIQFFRSLRVVRRAPERPHRRPAAVRDAVEQEHAAQEYAGRDDAEHAHQARSVQGQDRRQGRDAHARRARALSEGQPPQGRLLADGHGARAHADAGRPEIVSQSKTRRCLRTRRVCREF